VDFFMTRDFSFLIWNYEFGEITVWVLRAVRCSLRNLNSTEAQRKHENHQGRPKLTSEIEARPKRPTSKAKKKRPIYRTE
jgi:hypothetical protein